MKMIEANPRIMQDQESSVRNQYLTAVVGNDRLMMNKKKEHFLYTFRSKTDSEFADYCLWSN